ncbi:hypothetical protein COX05_01575 [candidate division WWE3 bacterium CG22_combo_CG10-13_8_21_14_all_39_12]|uniref:Uncharacterized protein n=2 Tax=Katanobacteria TaxID=422282 RepID=A0A2M7X1J8_UNCKA|nr:MAG: hypothetical protein COX05_01575 [candidate division WWE3 bacterium CG22_combo_CG10-13_8_21_14_all_39_12]PJA40044.1 MAG: hypothetical protein CO179_03555 [candidate division WWE3 bacterium CG_4_9_14_3_um_filter_39_7]
MIQKNIHFNSELKNVLFLSIISFCHGLYMLIIANAFLAQLIFLNAALSDVAKYIYLSGFVLVYAIWLFVLLNWGWLRDSFRVQNIHNQRSWVYYYQKSLISAPVISVLMGLLINWGLCSDPVSNIACSQIIAFKYAFNPEYVFLTIFAALLGSLLLHQFLKSKFVTTISDIDEMHAPGSVGINSDTLDYNPTAKSISDSFLNYNNYVEVVALWGAVGTGKSSLARMILESIDPKERLYTYISLTETNEDMGFSILFSKRWKETLRNRYPKINHFESVGIIGEIVKGFTQSNLSSYLLEFTPWLKIPIFETKAKTHDSANDKLPVHVNNRVAQLFSNVNEIEEKIWIIVIDEIERSKLSEIYRVIEIIERFKIIGRDGLPVKLVFLLPMAEDNMRELILESKSTIHAENAHLVSNFLFNDPKHITKNLFVPNATIMKRVDVVRLEFINLAENLGVKTEMLKNVQPNRYASISKYEDSEEKAAEYALSIFAEETPRIINRVVNECEKTYPTLRHNDFRLIEVLLVTLLRIKHPIIISFLIKTINYFTDKRGSIDYYELNKRFKDKDQKESLTEWINEVVGFQLPSGDADQILGILGIVANYLLFTDRHNSARLPDLLWSFSLNNPARMLEYLNSFSPTPNSNTDVENLQLYLNYKDNNQDNNQKMEQVFEDLENDKLDNHANFLRSRNEINIRANFYVAQELVNRLSSKQIKPDITKSWEGPIYSASYEIMFNILSIIENDTKDKNTSNDAINLLHQVFTDPTVPAETKLLLVSTFFNRERQKSDIDFRFEKCLETIKELDPTFPSLVQTVFNGIDTKYIRDGAVLYEHEESPSYVIYQNWSGKSHNQIELDNMKSSTLKGLREYPQVIEYYLRQLPYKPNFEDVDDLKTTSIHDTSLLIYIDIDELVSISKEITIYGSYSDAIKELITEYDQKIIQNPSQLEKFKNWRMPKDTNDTLRSAMVRAKLLTETRVFDDSSNAIPD